MGKPRILPKIEHPHDIKKLSIEELHELAGEVRELIIDTVCRTGGHLGSNLGVVELTLALHHVLDVTHDLIVWDGSYQTYTHKILTGRRDRFHTLRQFGGISGFSWKDESDLDPFNFGHVGTGLATAFGARVADDFTGRKRKVVAIIGDGSLTCGVAYEALNNIGASKRDMLVIVNDNGFSISPSVGAISTYFTELRSTPIYEEAKGEIHRVLSKIPLGEPIEHVLDSVRRGINQAVFPNIFEAMGFQYYGPVDGHDIKALLHILRNLRQQHKPVLLHVVTKKGKGHPDADRDPFGLHKALEKKPAPPKATVEATCMPPVAAAPKPKAKSFTAAFIDNLIELAEKDPRIVGLTAAMPDGTGMLDFAKKFPTRMFDVGISEQACVAIAAGMAHSGLRPVCAIYSSFNQRAYDIVFQEMCLNNLPVLLVLDRAGIAGEDGPTHHGNFDISALRTFPNITLLAPRDGADLRAMLETALQLPGPSVLRLPRENVPDLSRFGVKPSPVEVGRGEILARGRHGAILAYGIEVVKALEAREILAKEGIDVTVADARFAKPIDADLVVKLLQEHPFVLTVEDHTYVGGFGSAVLEAASLRNAATDRIKIHAIPDRFLQHANRVDLLKFLYLDAAGIADVVRPIVAGQPHRPEVPADQRGAIFCHEKDAKNAKRDFSNPRFGDLG